MNEEWRKIKDFPDYEVNNFGNVRSCDRYRMTGFGSRLIKGQVLRPNINKKRGGYAYISLCHGSKHHSYKVHRLVAEAFIPNPEMKPFVNHIDCNPANNRVDNLEWVTAQENTDWMFACERQATLGKPVIATDPITKEVTWFKSAKEAERCGHTRAAIWRVITGEYKTHHGLIWSYAK